jgi:alpha/beta superfamily hydrolase
MMTKPNFSSKTGVSEPITLQNMDLVLEGFLSLVPQTEQPGLVMLHPHPLYGGSMEDSRLQLISQAAVEAGINTLRFNFRGVGTSQGSFNQGIGEVQDAICAVNHLRNHPHIDKTRIALLGYSFGGSIALAATIAADPAALVTISAALHAPNVDPALVSDTLRYIRCPCYILHGREDDVIPFVNAEGIHAQLQVKEKYLRLVRGADHFWRNKLAGIIPMILAFLRDKLHIKRK